MEDTNNIPYNPIITHDVDRYYKWKAFKSIIGESYRILSYRSSWSFAEAWQSFFSRKIEDPFSNLTKIAELDSNAGLQSVFYIMTTQENHPKNINDYNVMDVKIQATLKNLISIGSEIGIHPGIFTFNDQKRMLAQKEKLEESIQQTVVRSRQHYLKYENPKTFRLLESVGIENDSSILVDINKEENKEKQTTYFMFDDEVNEYMKISQTPLVFMDTHYMHLKDDEILGILEEKISPAKKSGGEIMILWHNNNVSNSRELGLYKDALEVIKN